MNKFVIYFSLIIVVVSCQKNCQTCEKSIGGVVSTDVVETKEVCDAQEAQNLEDSSAGTTVWNCK